MSYTDPTDLELSDLLARLESHYAGQPARYPRRDTYVDALGYGRWVGVYHNLRHGLAHEPATAEVMRRIAVLEAQGTTPTTPEPPASGRTPAFVVDGTTWRDARSLRRQTWRGITAFPLASLVLNNPHKAEAWVREASNRGRNVLRVLTMCDWLSLPPELGIKAIPGMFELADAYGMTLEIVGLSDTEAFGFDPDDCLKHVAAVAAVAAAAAERFDRPYPLVQAANEPYHGTHIGWLGTEEARAEFDRYSFGPVAVCYGAAAIDEDTKTFEPGHYITRHLDRGRDPLNMVRRIRELHAVREHYRKPVINGEMIGAGPEELPGKRLTDPSIFFLAAALSRLFDVGYTFHLEAGLRCDPLSVQEEACLEAVCEAEGLVPPIGTFQNSNNPREDGSRPWPNSPIQNFDETKIVRAYSGMTTENSAVVVVFGGAVDAGRLEWHRDWRPVQAVAPYPNVRLFLAERR